jgi:pimeloyl-ACP methyl ester carboxylesterase
MNQKHIFFISFLFLFSCKPENKALFQTVFKVSEDTTHEIKEGQEFTFGYLEVPENRMNPASRSIQIPVYIFKSRSMQPKKDPIIYTVGGPGSSTMRSAQYMNYYKYLDDRDFILVEQRGTRYSKPHLDCPEWAKAVYESNLPNFNESNSDAHFEKAAQACRDRLTKKGIDLNGYNTNEIAADINDLVNVMNIEKYNLLTLSYSTKIGQVLMRDYPEKIRSVVMDSPLPLEVNYDEESVANLLELINTLLSDCESDANCNAAYPNLKSRFFEYLRETTKNPLEVTVKNPNNGEMETFRLKGKDLTTVFSSISNGMVPYIPSEIEKLLNGDLRTVQEQLSSLFQGPGTGEGLGMRLSVWCAEEYPFNSQVIIQEETQKYPEVTELQPAVFKQNICQLWSIEKVDDIENEPIKSDIPTLLINGSYDPDTPVKWAQNMIPNLSNSYHVIFNGWTHGPTTNWSNNCAMQVANAFFNDPRKKPNPACFEKVKSPKFVTE